MAEGRREGGGREGGRREGGRGVGERREGGRGGREQFTVRKKTHNLNNDQDYTRMLAK